MRIRRSSVIFMLVERGWNQDIQFMNIYSSPPKTSKATEQAYGVYGEQTNEHSRARQQFQASERIIGVSGGASGKVLDAHSKIRPD